MKYSVVTTVYNDEMEIIPFLDNLLLQTKIMDEIVIVDGGSCDRTIQLIQEYSSKKKVKIKLFYGERLNIAQGFNRGIQNADNEMIAIAAVGNWYPPNYFKILVEEIENDHTLDAVYGLINGKNSTRFARLYNKTFLNGNAYKKLPSNHGVLIKKSVIVELGFFYEKLKYAGEDYEFYFRFLRSAKRCKCVKTVSVIWETPKSFYEYYKQVQVYTVALMQIYSNMSFLFVNKMIIGYVLLWNVLAMSFLMKRIDIFWVSLFLISLSNVKWAINKKSLVLKNIDCFLKILLSFKECKYMFAENKIDKKYRIMLKVRKMT